MLFMLFSFDQNLASFEIYNMTHPLSYKVLSHVVREVPVAKYPLPGQVGISDSEIPKKTCHKTALPSGWVKLWYEWS